MEASAPREFRFTSRPGFNWVWAGTREQGRAANPSAPARIQCRTHPRGNEGRPCAGQMAVSWRGFGFLVAPVFAPSGRTAHPPSHARPMHHFTVPSTSARLVFAAICRLCGQWALVVDPPLVVESGLQFCRHDEQQQNPFSLSIFNFLLDHLLFCRNSLAARHGRRLLSINIPWT